MTRPSQPSVKAIRDAHPFIGYYDAVEGDDPPACWACGRNDVGVKKAHIVALWNGGTSDPSNFFLLCPPCYGEQDACDGMPPAWQWAWLRSHESNYARSTRLASNFIAHHGITTEAEFRALMEDTDHMTGAYK